MKTIDVLIIIEHKAREFECACLLKTEFNRRGLSADVVSIYPNKEKLPLIYHAKIIIIPWAYSDNSMKYINCFFSKSPEAVIINMHHEQYAGQDNAICLPTGQATKMFHVSWGEKFSEDLVQAGCLVEDILNVGNIRLDFYKKPLINLSCNKSALSNEYHIPIDKKWVLFIGDGFHLMDSHKIDELNRSNPLFNEMRIAGVECRNSFLEYTDNYLENNKDVVFIYRPHPVYADKDKHSDEIEHLIKKYPRNFFCISSKAIRDWIVNCDSCISFHSTSVVECNAADKPYYLLRTSDITEEIDYPFFKDFKYCIKDYDDFLGAINAENYDNLYVAKCLEKYYLQSSKPAYQMIADMAVRVRCKYLIRPTFNQLLVNWYKYLGKSILSSLAKINFVEDYLMNAKDSRFYRLIEKGDDIFTQEDVDLLCQKINELLEEGGVQ